MGKGNARITAMVKLYSGLTKSFATSIIFKEPSITIFKKTTGTVFDDWGRSGVQSTCEFLSYYSKNLFNSIVNFSLFDRMKQSV